MNRLGVDILSVLDKPITIGFVLGLLVGWGLLQFLFLVACWLAELHGRWKERKSKRMKRLPENFLPQVFLASLSVPELVVLQHQLRQYPADRANRDAVMAEIKGRAIATPLAPLCQS